MIIALWIVVLALAGVVARHLYVNETDRTVRDQAISDLNDILKGPFTRKVSESNGYFMTNLLREGGLASEVAALRAQAIETDHALSDARSRLSVVEINEKHTGSRTEFANKRLNEFYNELRTDTVDVDISKYDVTIGKKVRALYEFLGLEEDLSPGTPGTRSTPPKVVAVRKAGPKKGKT